MAQRKVVFTMQLPQETIHVIQSVVPDWEIVHGADKEVWLPHLAAAEIVAGWNVHAVNNCLQENSSLRWVQAWGAGVNNMPFAQFKKLGIVLTNASGVHANPISETIFAMMLGYTRMVHTYIRDQKDKNWRKTANLLEMHGKTIGIIGVGAIGLETARLAKAFGMRVLGLRRSAEPTDFIDKMYPPSGLNELLSQSDYIVHTLPLTQETQHMIGREQFSRMKPNAFFVNIGRGQTVDTNALIDALRENRIAGAGLDVFEQEPLPVESPLWEMENVIITPHTSGATEKYNQRVMDIFLPNLRDYLQGRELQLNRVDLDAEY